MRVRGAVLVGALLAVLLIAIGAANNPAANFQAAGDPIAGVQVFAKAGCAGCHTLAAAGSKGMVGPNLDQLKPTVATVVRQVTAGGGGMPPFSAILSGTQIADVAAYVAQASRGWRPPPPGTTSEPGTTPAAPAGSKPATLAVTIKERRLITSARRVLAGPITFVVRNTGRQEHQLVVLRSDRPLRALPMLGERAREVGRRARLRLVRPGATRRLTVTLRPGRYLLIDNRPRHYRAGEVAALLVSSPPAPAPTQPAGTEPPPSEPPPQDGRTIFGQYCGACHTLSAAGTGGTVGPNLDEKRPSFDRVVKQLNDGDVGMPSFAGVLSEQQIAAVATFVAQATAGATP